jgi:hypothetical protein
MFLQELCQILGYTNLTPLNTCNTNVIVAMQMATLFF